MKKIKYKHGLAISIIFFAVLVLLPIATLIMPKESFSQIENKSLQSLPKFSVAAVFDGSYADKLETYISDHFVGRVEWISLKAKFEYILGKREQKGIYILSDRLIEKVDQPDYSSIDKSIAAINKFADSRDIPINLMLVPTSEEFYKNELPSYMPNLDQKKFIEYVYDRLNDRVSTIDVYQTLMINRDDYIFYRTDHHWTSKGAFYAYTAVGKKIGYTPNPYSAYDVEHASSDFHGTFYSKTLYDGITPDTIDIFHCQSTNTPVNVSITSEFGKEPTVYDSMYFRDYLNVKDKYSLFFGPNQPLVDIETGHSGDKLLVIKDSYAHSFVPFLTEHYSDITMLDLRYIQIGIDSVIDVSDYDRILILYNVSSFVSDTNLRKLGYGS